MQSIVRNLAVLFSVNNAASTFVILFDFAIIYTPVNGNRDT